MCSQDAFERHLQDVFKTSSRRLSRRLKDGFSRHLLTSRGLQEDVLQTRLEDVLKEKKCYTEDLFKTFLTPLHHGECLLGYN